MRGEEIPFCKGQSSRLASSMYSFGTLSEQARQKAKKATRDGAAGPWGFMSTHLQSFAGAPSRLDFRLLGASARFSQESFKKGLQTHGSPSAFVLQRRHSGRGLGC